MYDCVTFSHPPPPNTPIVSLASAIPTLLLIILRCYSVQRLLLLHLKQLALTGFFFNTWHHLLFKKTLLFLVQQLLQSLLGKQNGSTHFQFSCFKRSLVLICKYLAICCVKSILRAYGNLIYIKLIQKLPMTRLRHSPSQLSSPGDCYLTGEPVEISFHFIMQALPYIPIKQDFPAFCNENILSHRHTKSS